jgi:hypothetical protein
MEFTETEQEILVNAWVLAREGKGQVLEDWAEPDAQELADAGWLEPRTVDATGHRAWFWTRQAETALDMNALRRDDPRGPELMCPSKNGHRPPLAGGSEGRITLAECGRPVQKRRERARPCRAGCHIAPPPGPPTRRRSGYASEISKRGAHPCPKGNRGGTRPAAEARGR